MMSASAVSSVATVSTAAVWPRSSPSATRSRALSRRTTAWSAGGSAAKLRVLLPGTGAAVVATDQGDQAPLAGRQAEPLGVA